MDVTMPPFFFIPCMQCLDPFGWCISKTLLALSFLSYDQGIGSDPYWHRPAVVEKWLMHLAIPFEGLELWGCAVCVLWLGKAGKPFLLFILLGIALFLSLLQWHSSYKNFRVVFLKYNLWMKPVVPEKLRFFIFYANYSLAFLLYPVTLLNYLYFPLTAYKTLKLVGSTFYPLHYVLNVNWS